MEPKWWSFNDLPNVLHQPNSIVLRQFCLLWGQGDRPEVLIKSPRPSDLGQGAHIRCFPHW